jgi:hypothetical protein
MAYDLDAVLKFQNPFGNLPPLTEAQKQERRNFESKAFERENYKDACKALAKKL